MKRIVLSLVFILFAAGICSAQNISYFPEYADGFLPATGVAWITSIVVTKEMGLGMALAVLVDATIIRSLLVPATMRLLGRWNWWMPGRRLPAEQAG